MVAEAVRLSLREQNFLHNMDTLQVTRENALKAYNSANSELKTVLQNLLGEEVFKPKNIMDRVRSFEDACEVLGISSDYDLDIPDECGTASVAHYKLMIIAKALNEGWKPNWKNSNEYKYYPWFDFSSGSGLSFHVYVLDHSDSLVGSRLCFKSRELAEYAGKQFIDLYTGMMTF